MDTARIEAEKGQGLPKAPRGPSAAPQAPAPGANGPPENGRPVLYPVRLRVNVNVAMMQSLQRVCRRWGIPEGIGARIAITQFLAQQDPQYRSE